MRQAIEKAGSSAALARLRRELGARGWCRKDPLGVLVELLASLLLTITGIGLFLVAGPWPLAAFGMLLSTAGSIGVATNTHTSSHYATSRRRWVNELLTYFGCPFFLGFSATYWWHKHLGVHHTSPNVVGVDEDMELWPWFAMTEAELSRAGSLRRLYYRKGQWLVFPALVALNGFNMQRAGLLHLGRMLADRRRRNTRHWIDLAALVAHAGTWVGLPLLFFAPEDVLTFYVLRIVMMGYAMFAVFAPAHFPAEAACVDAGQRAGDPLLLQTATTLNFRGGFLARLVCSGLDYQIEHHLFPGISHLYYRRMSPLVQQFCKEQGLPYRSYPWGIALWKSWMVLRTPQRVESRLEPLPTAHAVSGRPSPRASPAPPR